MSFEGFSLFFFPRHDFIVHYVSDTAYKKRQTEDEDGEFIVSDADGVAAHRGGHDGGKARERSDYHPRGKFDLGESREVGQHVLGRSRHREYEKHGGSKASALLKTCDGVNFFTGEENLHNAPSQRTHEQKHDGAAYRDAQKTE